jgi:hypothetical protein
LTPEEEAKAFAYYLKNKKWGDITRLATKIGKSIPYIYRRLALLKITEESLTEKKTITAGNALPTHKREIGRIHDPKTQKRIMKEIANAVGNLNFKDTQSLSCSICDLFVQARYPSDLVRNFSSTFRVCSGYFL